MNYFEHNPSAYLFMSQQCPVTIAPTDSPQNKNQKVTLSFTRFFDVLESDMHVCNFDSRKSTSN